MNVFISWSGPLSCKLAEAVHWWLPHVLHVVKPYFSPEDIGKGTRWSSETAEALAGSKFGVSCLTRDNLTAPWVLFEAGAISKTVTETRLWTVLFDMEEAEVTGPLAQFQAMRAVDKKDMLRLITEINRQCGEHKRDDKACTETFEKWWPDFDDQVTSLLQQQPAQDQAQKREPQDLLEEILSLARDTANRVAELSVADRKQKAALVAAALTSARSHLLDALGEQVNRPDFLDGIGEYLNRPDFQDVA